MHFFLILAGSEGSVGRPLGDEVMLNFKLPWLAVPSVCGIMCEWLRMEMLWGHLNRKCCITSDEQGGTLHCSLCHQCVWKYECGNRIYHLVAILCWVQDQYFSFFAFLFQLYLSKLIKINFLMLKGRHCRFEQLREPTWSVTGKQWAVKESRSLSWEESILSGTSPPADSSTSNSSTLITSILIHQ